MSAEILRDNDRVVVRFQLPHQGDDVISVVGSFNGWTPGVHVLQPTSRGTLEVIAEVDHPGDVHFRYLATNGRWFDDDSADRIDEFGTTLIRREADELPPLAPAKKAAPAKKGTAAKKVAAKKAAPAKKVAAEKAAATAGPVKSAAAKKVAATKAAKNAEPASKTAAKKAPADKAAAKKAPADKAAAKKAPADKTAAKKSPAKKA